MLSGEETIELLRRSKQGDAHAKEKLLVENTSLIKSIIKRFIRKGVEYDDLFQLGCLGFVKAIANFDESFNVRFSTYAVPMVVGEIKRYLRDDGAIKVSRLIKSLSYKINQYTEERLQMGEPSPTVAEIAEAFGVEEEEVALAIGSAKPLVSLSEPVVGDADKPVELIEKLPAEEGEDEMVDRIMLRQVIDELPQREKKIIILRYFRDKTQSEIAKELGVSQVQVSRLEQSTLKKLRAKM